MLRSSSKNFILLILIWLISLPGLYPESDIFDLKGLNAKEAYERIIDKLLEVESRPDSLNIALDLLEANYQKMNNEYHSREFLYKVEWALNFFRGRYLSHSFIEDEKAEEYLNNAYTIAFLHKNDKWMLSSLFELANFYYFKNYYQMARAKYKEALPLAKKISDEERTFKILHNLAIINKLLNDYSASFEYFNEAEVIRQRQDKEESLGMLYNNRGSAYNDTNQQAEAIRDYKWAENLLVKYGSDREKAILFNNLGNYYMQEKENDTAMQYFSKALELKPENSSTYMTTQINIGYLYNNQDNLPETLQILGQAEKICEQKGYFPQLLDIYSFYNNYYADNGDFAQASSYLKKYYALSESFRGQENTLRLMDLQNYYKLGKQDQDSAVLETENAINKTRLHLNTIIMISVIIIILFLSGCSVYIVRRKKYRKIQINTLLEKNRILEDQRQKTTIVLNTLQKMKIHLENQISKEVKHIREKDSMILIQSRNSAVGEMIGNIAHQWRQPINAIGILIQDFADAYEFGELDEAYIQEKVVVINNLIEYMNQTIDDFKNFFSPDKREINFAASEVVERAIDFVACSFSARNIDYNITIDQDFTTFGSENELFQAILNILNNAKDAFQENEIKQPQVRIDLSIFENTGYITIQDNAGGVKEDIIENVFEPYVTTKTERKGTGIGLYIVKNIVEINFTGSIQVENLDGGARFTIKLPIYS